ncbi:hypothetical protein KPL74_06280 [Bacillus sp. NP157]|nr:hypothetical protein KPL74_06280 [Bacillus sp. NP157]
MKSLRAAIAALCAIGLPYAASTQASTVVIPVEVLSNGTNGVPVVVPVQLSLETGDIERATELYVVCSRCGRYGAPEFLHTFFPIPANTASMRLLGGVSSPAAQAGIPWMDIADANVGLPIEERLAGGVNGGFYTVHAIIPLTDEMRKRLVSGAAANTIEFRFNGTDGMTNGFRIVDIAFRDAGHRRLGHNDLVQADPLVEHKAGAVHTGDADRGQALWASGHLLKSKLVHLPINATCGSCHASHGQDLQYFNYSDHAIEQRAQYHGFSAEQARQVRAYIRYANRDLPYAPNARPYNPPYQPGPGLDMKDVSQWAAGAGLDAVVTTAADAARAAFGKDATALTQADVDRTMSANATLNTRETALPLQLPDWNAWLPTIAPEDVWPTTGGSGRGSFFAGATFADGGFTDPWGKYNGILTRLSSLAPTTGPTHDWALVRQADRTSLRMQFFLWGADVYAFLGGQRGNHIKGGGLRWGAEEGALYLEGIADSTHKGAGMSGPYSHEAFVERAVSSLLQWNIVKQWEIVHDANLEGDQQLMFGDTVDGAWVPRGERRGWMFNAAGVFYVAPHMMYQKETLPDGKVRESRFAWETSVPASVYRTNAWYQLQMVINAGAQDKFGNLTVDWPYAFDFDQQAVDELVADGATDAAAAQAIRLLQAHVKAAQYVNNHILINDPDQPDLLRNPGFGSKAMADKHLTPAYYVDYRDPLEPVSRFRLLDTIAPGLQLKTVNGAILETNELYSMTDVGAWRRCAPPGVSTSFGNDEAMAGFAFCLDEAPRALPLDRKGNAYLPWYFRTLYQNTIWGYASARALGAEPSRMATWLNWIQRAWPGYTLPTITQSN